MDLDKDDKLGYECNEIGTFIRYKLYDPDDIMTIYISFNKKTKRVIIRCENDCLGIDELKASYTQIKELL